MTITTSLNDFENRIAKYANSDDFIESQLYSRVGNAAFVPTVLLSTALDTIIGLGITLESLLSLCKNPSINDFASNHTLSSNRILSLSFKHVIRVINPQADFAISTMRLGSSISIFGVQYLAETAEQFVKEGGWQAHVVSRLIYATALPLACLATRVVDLAIGVLFVPLCLITLGLSEIVNNIAARSLKSPGIIHDAAYCVGMTLNPWGQKLN